MKKQKLTGWFIDPTDSRAMAYIQEGKVLLGLFHDSFIKIDRSFPGVDDYEGYRATTSEVMERIKVCAINMGLYLSNDKVTIKKTPTDLKIFINGNQLTPVDFNK